ncbi:MAG: PqqD family protein [Candidatus Omnitrophica bacterium]|nr:PqqD family protein [Candidatus Omnitrophota bacterium]
MRLLLDKVPKRRKNLAWRKIDKEVALISLEKNQKPEKLNIFNKTAAYIWELIDGKNSIRQIIQKITNSYQIVPEKAKKEATEFIKSLVKRNLIKVD